MKQNLRKIVCTSLILLISGINVSFAACEKCDISKAPLCTGHQATTCDMSTCEWRPCQNQN